MSPSDLYDARKTNRWATVTESKIVNHGHPALTFVAVYDDGVKMKVVEDANAAWIVKKDSIPRIDSIYSNIEESYIFHGVTAKVVEILKTSMLYRKTRELYRVQTGVNGDHMSVDDYLFQEGVIEAMNEADRLDEEESAYDVVGPDGIIVTFSGTAAQAVEWLNGKSDEIRKGSMVGRTGSEDLISAEAFLSKYST